VHPAPFVKGWHCEPPGIVSVGAGHARLQEQGVRDGADGADVPASDGKFGAGVVQDGPGELGKFTSELVVDLFSPVFY